MTGSAIALTLTLAGWPATTAIRSSSTSGASSCGTRPVRSRSFRTCYVVWGWHEVAPATRRSVPPGQHPGGAVRLRGSLVAWRLGSTTVSEYPGPEGATQ
jgi:hypothetical protein